MEPQRTHLNPGFKVVSHASSSLYCELVSKACIDGIARQQGAAGVDVGASSEAPVEPALDEAGATEAAAEPVPQA